MKIIGEPEMPVEARSSVALRCIVTNAILRPRFVYWYRDKVVLWNSRTLYARESITIRDDINKNLDGADKVSRNFSRSSNLSTSNKRLSERSRVQTNEDNRLTLWNRNKNDNSEMSEVNFSTMKAVSTILNLKMVTSILTIHEASSKHSGRYQCAPDNTRPAAINLHVIQGEDIG